VKVAINGRFLSQQITGVQRHARELVRALDCLLADDPAAGRDAEVSLLLPPNAVPDLDLRSISPRRVGRLTGQLWEQIELPLHARGSLLLSLANAAPAALRRQVVTVHDALVFAAPETFSRAYRSWYRVLLPLLGRRAALVLTDSEFSRAELARRAGMPAARIRVVPGGHEHILQTPAAPDILARHGLADRRYVLAVSSRSRHKNLRAVAEAMALLGDRDWVYVFAGGGNARIFGDQAETWPAGVRALGYVTDGELRALYEHAECFVFPSFYEGFGYPPLEAMACGCPVVVSRAASLPEVCGEAAVYIDPADPRDLAAALERVMGDEGLRLDLRRRGLAQAKRFSWGRTARQVLEILREEASR
jgi:glycosyltransferase involved in cell wall biosynthesis